MEFEKSILELIKVESKRSKFRSWNLSMQLFMEATKYHEDVLDDTIAILQKSIVEIEKIKEWRKMNGLSVRQC